MSDGVLLLAYGGPTSLADIPAYLDDIRGGRPASQQLLETITERYRQIGGRSPLLDITRATAAKLHHTLGLPVYVGMRHWHPYIRDVVPQIITDGVTRLVAICMAPHYSRLSIAAYRAKLDEALAEADARLRVDFVESWHTQADYLAGIAANVRSAMARFPASTQDRVKVIFTAHSLPAFILAQGDPYDRQLRETAALLTTALALPEERWTLAYQSAARTQSAAQTGQPWLGPMIEDLVSALADAGERNILVAPIGFISDHVEVLYDIDIAVTKIARARGVRLERTPMLNDSPAMVAALVGIVQQQA